MTIDLALPIELLARQHGAPTPARRVTTYFRHALPVPDRSHAMLPDPHVRPVVSAEEAFDELGIDRTTGYRAIREGRFPVPVIRVGRLIRVPTMALQRLLELGDAPPPPNERGKE